MVINLDDSTTAYISMSLSYINTETQVHFLLGMVMNHTANKLSLKMESCIEYEVRIDKVPWYNYLSLHRPNLHITGPLTTIFGYRTHCKVENTKPHYPYAQRHAQPVVSSIMKRKTKEKECHGSRLLMQYSFIP